MSGKLASLPESALVPRRFVPTWELALSVLGHGLLLVVIGSGERCTRPGEPLIDMSKVMMVEAVALPKQTTALPQKAMHTEEAIAGSKSESAVPTPPHQSDLALHSKDAPEAKGVPKDRTADREALLREARKEALLKDIGT